MNLSLCFRIACMMCLGGLCYSGAVLAQEGSAEFFDLKLFSLSKHTEDAFDAPAAVYVITGEDIRRSGVTTIPDALRMVPGVQVAQQGAGKWAVSARGFNYQFANKLLVLLDGRVVYKPLFSGTLWYDVDVILEDIARIEVIRGPGATIWGSNAVNGIINIITKHAGSSKGNYLAVQGSDKGEGGISFRHGGQTDGGKHYRVYAQQARHANTYTLDQNSAEDDWKSSLLGFRMDWKQDFDHTFTLQGDFRESRIDRFSSLFPTTTPPFMLENPLESQSRHINLLGKWDYQLDKQSQLQTQFYVDYDRTRKGTIDFDLYTLDIDTQHIWNINYHHELITGLGIRHMVDLQRNQGDPWLEYIDKHRYDTNYSAFIQDKIGIMPDKLYLTLGSKFEHNPFSGFNAQPSAKLTYFPDDNQTMWASVSRAIRTPSRNEKTLLYRIVGTPGGYIGLKHHQYKPNPEKLIAFEVGHRVRPKSNLLLESAIFYNHYTDLRNLEPVAPFADFIALFDIQNRGYGETYGMEVNARYQVNQHWRLQGSYSFLKMALHLQSGSMDPLFETQEGEAPQQQVTLQSFYQMTPQWSLDNSVYFVDNLPIGSQGVDSYIRLDTWLEWQASQGLELSLTGMNLLDSRHQEFSASLYSPAVEVGRTILLGATWEF